MQFLLLVIGLALFDVKEFEKLHTNKCISMWKVEKKLYHVCNKYASNHVTQLWFRKSLKQLKV